MRLLLLLPETEFTVNGVPARWYQGGAISGEGIPYPEPASE